MNQFIKISLSIKDTEFYHLCCLYQKIYNFNNGNNITLTEEDTIHFSKLCQCVINKVLKKATELSSVANEFINISDNIEYEKEGDISEHN